ncbi:MAG: hypothetical protein QOD42_26 [Sphingomonadales bacterium]|jgi:hypothetical protein|nr:hypothetical protein [Sphingomonadales bacterium]
MSGDDKPGDQTGELISLDETTAPDGTDAAPPGGAGAGAGGTAATGTAVAVQPYDPEETRKNIAYFLLWIMIGVIVAVVVVALMFSVDCWIHTDRCEPAKDALEMLTGSIAPVFTAMVGLVGSVVGFYFGSKER